MTDLPEPDSPTTHRISLRSMASETRPPRAADPTTRQRDAQVLDAENRLAHRSDSRGLRASLSPSPTRLMESTVSRMAIPGMVTSHHASRRKLRPAPHHEPPAHEVRSAETEEGEGALDEDGGGDEERAGDDQRRQGVGQHLAEEDRHVALSRQHRGLHVLPGLDRQHLAAHHAAMGGQLTTAMATMRLVADGVRMATSTMAKMNDGMVWKNSVRRISPSSTKPPK